MYRGAQTGNSRVISIRVSGAELAISSMNQRHEKLIMAKRGILSALSGGMRQNSVYASRDFCCPGGTKISIDPRICRAYNYSDKSDGGNWIQRFILGVDPGAAAVSRITWIRATLYLKVDGSGISSGMQNCLTHGTFNVFQTTNLSEETILTATIFCAVLRALLQVVSARPFCPVF